MSWGPLFVALGVAAIAAIVALMGVTMWISIRTSNWSAIDTFWGIGFVVVAFTSYR